MVLDALRAYCDDFESSFPQLKTVRFAEGWRWKRILEDVRERNRKRGQLVEGKGLRFFDGEGVEWDGERMGVGLPDSEESSDDGCDEAKGEGEDGDGIKEAEEKEGKGGDE